MQDSENKKSITIHLYFLFSLLSIAFVFGIFIGRGMRTIEDVQMTKGTFFKAKEGEFKYTHPLDAGEPSSSHVGPELKPFRYKVKAVIEARLAENEASAISVYFRDLNNGNWFGIQESEQFSPASLLKLPLMIAYFRWAEDNPLVLNKRISFVGPSVIGPGLQRKTRKTLESGKSYSIDNLIYRMIAYSDNDSFALLKNHLPPERLNRVYKDLYVDYDPAQPEDKVSLAAYAAFFRVLYNASYLNREMSEKALQYLSHEPFKEGMLSAVPPDIEMAHKFGERTVVMQSDEQEAELQQLHEFGIVYYPNRPYLIGIMTRGNDYNKLKKIIHTINRLVYEEIEHQSMVP